MASSIECRESIETAGTAAQVLRPQVYHRDEPSRAGDGQAGVMVTQDGRDSFFIDGKGGTAFQAARHIRYRIPARKMVG